MSSHLFDDVVMNQVLTMNGNGSITSQSADLQIVPAFDRNLILSTHGTGNMKILSGPLSRTTFATDMSFTCAVGQNSIQLCQMTLPYSTSTGGIKLVLKVSDQSNSIRFEEYSGILQAASLTLNQVTTCSNKSANLGVSGIQPTSITNSSGATIITFTYTFSVSLASSLSVWCFLDYYGDASSTITDVAPVVTNVNNRPIAASASSGAISAGTVSFSVTNSVPQGSATYLSQFIDNITPPIYQILNLDASSLSSLYGTLAQIQGNVGTQTNLLTTHTAQLSSLSGNISTLNSQSLAISGTLSRQDNVLNSYSASLTSLAAAVTPIVNSGSFASGSLASLNVAVACNTASLSSLQDTVSQNSQNASLLLGSISSISLIVTNNSQSLSALVSSLTSTQQIQSLLSSSLSALSATITTLSYDNQTVKTTVALNSGSLLSNYGSLTTLASQYASLSTSSIQLQGVQATISSSISSLSNGVSTISQVVSGLIGSATGFSSSLTNQSASIAYLSASVSLLNTEVQPCLLTEAFYANNTDGTVSTTSLPSSVTLPSSVIMNVIQAATGATYQTDTAALQFTGAVQLSVDLKQNPYNLNLSTINALIAANNRIYFSYNISIKRGGGTSLNTSTWPNTAFRLILNQTSNTDFSTNMFVDIPNDASVATTNIANQVDVTSLFSGLTSAVLTIYSNITTPNYLNLYSLSLYAAPYILTGTTLRLPGASIINLGSNQAKAVNAGYIGYQLSTPGALDIYGAGASVGSRSVKLWDSINVPGSITAASIFFPSSSIVFTGYTSQLINNSGWVSSGSAPAFSAVSLPQAMSFDGQTSQLNNNSSSNYSSPYTLQSPNGNMTLNLRASGGGGFTNYINFYQFNGQGSPGAQIIGQDDNNYAAHLLFYTAGAQRMYIASNGNVNIAGALSKGSGSFQIPHPVVPGKNLIHSFIEGPRCDLIYRGHVNLMHGNATVILDRCGTGMQDGTFEALCRDPDVFLSNNDTWDKVKGKVRANVLHIECENAESCAVISWMVVAERQDETIRHWDKTDAEGRLVLEHQST